MKLFDREKDLILRILNLILVVWFVGSLFFVTSNLINFFVKEPTSSYERFKTLNCGKYDYYYYEEEVELTEEEKEQECLRGYELYKSNIKDTDYNNLRGLYLSLGNVFIVGSFLVVLNPIKINTKKNK